MKILILLLSILPFLYSKNIDLEIENKKLIQEINRLEKIVKKQEILLKTKEKCEESSSFPNLMMKNEMVTFEASAFRLKTDSAIYDAPNGQRVDLWEKSRSFTSSSMMDGWIKISGYFVKQKWKKTQKELWVESTQAIKR